MRKGKAATWMLVAIAGLGGLEVALAQEVSRTGKSPSPVRAQSITIEAESLVAAAIVNGGTVSAQAMGGFGAGWSGGAQLFWNIGTPGAVLDLNIDIPASAEYAVELYFTKAPDYGQVRIEIAGKPASVVFDGYAPRVMIPIPTQAGRFALEAGQYNFSFQATGKNSQSGGYRIGIDQIRLYPVGALSGQTINAGKNVQTAQSAVQVPASSSNEAKPNPGGVGPPPPPQAPPKVPGLGCDSTCLGNVATVYRQGEDSKCQIWFRFPCTPYACDEAAGLCRTTCILATDCAQGALCDHTNGLCASASAVCADPYNVQLPNRETQSCSPYKCLGGVCQNVCATNGDCAPGYKCNSATGLCVSSSQNK